ncbi:MAG: hypothetical protein CL610_15785 [Anaerolineaceae bacterium]|nr:hypothetical protein [Anaerolineaceae bacterium]
MYIRIDTNAEQGYYMSEYSCIHLFQGICADTRTYFANHCTTISQIGFEKLDIEGFVFLR